MAEVAALEGRFLEFSACQISVTKIDPFVFTVEEACRSQLSAFEVALAGLVALREVDGIAWNDVVRRLGVNIAHGESVGDTSFDVIDLHQ